MTRDLLPDVKRNGMLEPRLRAYICLHVFVLMQHGYYDKASVWLELLHGAGDRSEHVLFTRSAALFLEGRYPEAVAALQEADRHHPIERFGEVQVDDRQKLRVYMRTRCAFEMKNAI
jgi:hypothetical protein